MSDYIIDEAQHAVLQAIESVRNTPDCAVEIAGVRIEACDTYGRTTTTKRAEAAASALADIERVIEALRSPHPSAGRLCACQRESVPPSGDLPPGHRVHAPCYEPQGGPS